MTYTPLRCSTMRTRNVSARQMLQNMSHWRIWPSGQPAICVPATLGAAPSAELPPSDEQAVDVPRYCVESSDLFESLLLRFVLSRSSSSWVSIAFVHEIERDFSTPCERKAQQKTNGRRLMSACQIGPSDCGATLGLRNEPCGATCKE